MKLCILLLCLLFPYAFSAVSFSFSGNVTVANPNAFSYRFVDAGDWTVGGIFSGGWFVSGSVDLTKVVDGGSASFDVVEAACYTGTGSYPVVWLAYFDEEISALLDFSGNLNNTNWAEVNVTKAGGFLGLVYLSIVEQDSAGNVYQTLQLKDVIWIIDLSSTGCNADKSLCWIGFTGTSLYGSLRIQYIVSRVIGKLNGFSNLVVTPKGIETIFYINSWSSVKSTNFLTLNTGIGSAQVAASADGTLATSDTGNNRVYIGFAKNAVVNSSPVSVTVGEAVYADFNSTLGGVAGNLQAQVQARYGRYASATLVNVSFPAGVFSNIVYDPSLGSGTAPQSSSGTIGASLLTLFAFLLVLFFKQ